MFPLFYYISRGFPSSNKHKKNSNKRILKEAFLNRKVRTLKPTKKSHSAMSISVYSVFLCHYKSRKESILYIIYKYIIYNINNLLTIYKFQKVMSFKKLNKLKLTSLYFFLIVIYSDFTNNLHQHISYFFQSE